MLPWFLADAIRKQGIEKQMYGNSRPFATFRVTCVTTTGNACEFMGAYAPINLCRWRWRVSVRTKCLALKFFTHSQAHYVLWCRVASNGTLANEKMMFDSVGDNNE